MSDRLELFSLNGQIQQDLQENEFHEFVDLINRRIKQQLNIDHHGDFSRWYKAITDAPVLLNPKLDVTQKAVTIQSESQENEQLKTCLKQLIPWRKGPYKFDNVDVDCEWRSDFKWDRIQNNINLKNKRVLDVGCGNGYHCWRMLELNPKWVLGIDPNILFNVQFRFVNTYAKHTQIDVVPLGIEHLPNDMSFFDTVFSMGVLYHRKSPIDHLYELKNLLARQGELILETLIIDGDENDVLVPKGRYAKMKNVWFIPSIKALTIWLNKVGFINVSVLDVSVTTIEEQRRTEWMLFESLEDYLDKDDPARTIEGYPSPKRVVISAKVT